MQSILCENLFFWLRRLLKCKIALKSFSHSLSLCFGPTPRVDSTVTRDVRLERWFLFVYLLILYKLVYLNNRVNYAFVLKIMVFVS